MVEYKQCRYSFLKAIKQAKCQRQSGVAIQRLSYETYGAASTDNPGLQNKTQSRTSPSCFVRFEDNPPTRPTTKDFGLSFSMANVNKTFKRLPAQTVSLAVSSEQNKQTSWLECLWTYLINPYPSLLSPHASRWPPLFQFPSKLR